jgi:L-methionine (R)-S-oxide reductase
LKANSGTNPDESTYSSKEERYQAMLAQANALIDPTVGWVANYANITALIQHFFQHWWCGFYFVNRNNQLELGPFQGPLACTLIGYDKGVCGKAWASCKTIIVPNVHHFDGHIACSSESNSEIVLPIVRGEIVVGVLDIDSIHFNHFDETDKTCLEKLLELMPDIGVKF